MEKPAVRRFSIGAPSEGILVTACSLAYGVLFSLPLLENLKSFSFFEDWDYAQAVDWAATSAVIRFHQFPAWNPYLCGGAPLLGHPLTRILTPFFLLHLLVDPAVAFHLEIALHLAIAWAGGYVLGRSIGLSKFAALGCATVFPSSSWFYLHMGAGHITFMTYLYCPWVIALAWLGIERRRFGWSAGAGAFLALAFFEGWVAAVTQTGLLLGLLVAMLVVLRRDPWPLISLTAVALFAAGLAAVKLLPCYFFWAQHPRPTLVDDGLNHFSLGGIMISLFSRVQFCTRTVRPFFYLFESGAYLGVAFAILALVGVLAVPRRSWPWAFAALLFLLLALGNFGPWSPWFLLHELPVFSSQRVAPRFLILFVLCVSVLTGCGIEVLSGWKPPIGVAAALLLLGIGTADAWLVGPPILVEHITGPEEPIPESPFFREYHDTTVYRMLRVEEAGMGVANCYDAMVFTTRATAFNQPDYKGEQYLLGPGLLTLARWTPDVLDYDVDIQSASVMVVNQNYDVSWRLARGQGEVVSHGGLLAVQLPAGRQQLELRYRSYPFRVGLIISFLTLAVILVIIRRDYVSSKRLRARWRFGSQHEHQTDQP